MRPSRNRPGSGGNAAVPSQIPAPAWVVIVKRVAREFGRHEMTIPAAGITFFGLFAVFSTIASFMAFYGLIADPRTVVQNMNAISGFVPADVVATLVDQMRPVSTQPTATLVLVAVSSLVVAVWSAQQGVAALILVLNTAYCETTTQSARRHGIKALGIAIALMVGLSLIAALVIAVPVVVEGLGGALWAVALVRAASMAVGGLCLLVGLSGLYRWAPHRRPPRWHWVGAGATVVVVFWAVSSILFSVFLAYSGSYTVTYGSLSAVVLLLTLTYVTVITVLAGAELNAQLEYHTTRDTTSGAPRPMGQRGAYVADHVADHIGDDEH